eukprot:CAMPEP_0197173988 /NCGR_PEP_ID=MMETSP1423-20130617/709_1 /TAXON_ID=476441 /ORGANISM="Pseudo-nitzschia heimii, Strain UNC1101" /LENGTH=303 /DNA_ID=CAMNT_0042622877 /DNA_START=159 /DNA_END=1067 /DNA_ORIENTATION=+
MSRTRFDAPRPVVTNRLGKQTDRLIQADGDTWHEFFAVSEKPNHAKTSNASSRSSRRFSLFGKNDKKKENSKKKSTKSRRNSSDTGDGNNLVIRSYYQNNRTGKRVWDEPPSGASNIVPASQEMRSMAELQLDEMHVVTDSTDFGDKSELTSGSGSRSKSRTSLFRRANSNASNSVSSGSSNSTSRRIQYKPNSHLYPPTASVKSRRDTINDQQLQEAIERSIAETTGPAAKHEELSEDDILRRVLEESRLEALASSRSQNSDRCYHDDGKPSPRKRSPMNTRRCPIDGESSYPTRRTKGNRW